MGHDVDVPDRLPVFIAGFSPAAKSAAADLCITDAAAHAASPAENRVPTLVLADTVHEDAGDAAAVVARPYSIGDVLAAVERVLPAE